MSMGGHCNKFQLRHHVYCHTQKFEIKIA